MRARCAALVATLLVITPAFAVGVPIPTEREKIVVVSGTLQTGYHKAFQAIVDAARPDVIAFRNPAGRLDEAMLTATEIRKHGLNTFVFADEPCASACALMFLAGERRYSVQGAEIGLRSGQAIEATTMLSEAVPIGRVLLALGVPAEIVSRTYAVGPTRTYWLTDKDRELLGIITLDGTTVAEHISPALPRSRPVGSTNPNRKSVQQHRRSAKSACETISGNEPPTGLTKAAAPRLDFLPVPDNLPVLSGLPDQAGLTSTRGLDTLLDPTSMHSADLVVTPSVEFGGETSLWLHPAFELRR